MSLNYQCDMQEAVQPVTSGGEDTEQKRYWAVVDPGIAPWQYLADVDTFARVEDSLWGDLYVPDDTQKTVDLMQEDPSMLSILLAPEEDDPVDAVRGYDLAYRQTPEWVDRMYTAEQVRQPFHDLVDDFDEVYGIHQMVVHPDDRYQTYGQQGVQFRQQVLESQWGDDGSIPGDGAGPDPDIIYGVVRWREIQGEDYGPERPIHHIARKYGEFTETGVTFESGGYQFQFMYRPNPALDIDPDDIASYFPDRFVTDTPEIEL